MTAEQWIGAAVGTVTLAGSYGYMVRLVFSIKATADEAKSDAAEIKRERVVDKAAYEERLRRVEAIAPALEALGKSIEHMGERFSQDMKHMAAMQEAHNVHVTAQLSDIKHDYKNLRMVAEAKPKPRPRRAA